MVWAGAATAPRLESDQLGLLVLLCLAAICLRRAVWAYSLACFTLTAALASAYWVGPARDVGSWRLHGPLRMVVCRATEWAPSSTGGWFVRTRVRAIRQGPRVAAADLAASLQMEVRPPDSKCLRIVGTLRAPARYFNGSELVVGSWALRVKSPRFVEPVAPGRPLNVIRWLRQTLDRRLRAQPAGRPARAVTEALVLGRGSSLDPRWARGLRGAGLGHVVAVSGLHLGLLAGMAWMATARLPSLLRVASSLTVVLAYAAIVGDRPSVRRAAVMVSLLLLSKLLRRPPSTLNALAGAIVLLVLVRPDRVLDSGFQLSVAATGGVLLLSPLLVDRWRLQHSWVGKGLAVSVAAHLATLPVAVPLFAQLSLGGPAWNLLGVPVVALLLAVCMMWALLLLLVPEAGAAVAPLVDVMGSLLAVPSLLPLPLLGNVPLALTMVGAAWVTLVLVVASLARGVPQIGATLLSVFLIVPQRANDGVQMQMLDVGQGDGVLLRDDGRTLIVDGGGWREGDFGSRVLRPILGSLGVGSLDVAVVTHFDADHCGGVAQLSDSVRLGEVWATSRWGDAACAAPLLFEARRPLRVLWAGDVLKWGSWTLRVLHPPPGAGGSSNDLSLVLLAEARGHRVLLTGDITASVESALARGEIKADFLKVAHHGSRSSTSVGFLRAVRPRAALISAGAGNRYGHPSEEVLQRLYREGVQVLRTDRHGMVSLRFEKEGVKVAVAGRWTARPPGNLTRVVRRELE